MYRDYLIMNDFGYVASFVVPLFIDRYGFGQRTIKTDWKKPTDTSKQSINNDLR